LLGRIQHAFCILWVNTVLGLRLLVGLFVFVGLAGVLWGFVLLILVLLVLILLVLLVLVLLVLLLVLLILVLLVFVPLMLKGLANYATLYMRSIVREKNVRSAFLAASLALAILFGFESLLNRTYPGALLAVPLAVIGSHAVLRPGRDWLSELAMWWLLAAALWMRWMG